MQWTCVFDIKKIFLTICAFMFLCLASVAQESLITSVAISKPKDLNGAYQLTIKADKPVEYKQKAETSDSIYFDLKNALTVDNIDTIYDNVSGIDALIVQQLENSKVRIYVNGTDTSNTKIVFETKQITGSNTSNQIVLNRPIREYRPTNDFNEITDENIDWDDNSFNPEHLLSSFFGIFGEKSDMTLVVCIILLATCILVSKKVFAKVKLQEEPLIGLSSAYKNDKEYSDEQGLDIVYKTQKNTTSVSRSAQTNSLRFAQNPYQNQKLRTQMQKNPIKQNYALNAYQNAQKNPYVSKSTPNRPVQTVTYQKRAQKSSPDFVSRVQSANNSVSNAPKQSASVESIKFLESVTKIYEQSGRKDLAQGLRAGINSKRKTAV